MAGPRWTRRALLGAAAALTLGGPAAPRAARGAASARNDIIGTLSYHVTHRDETLLDLARQYDLGLLELLAANPGFDPWIPAHESLLTLPTAHILPDAPRRGLIVNLAELRLYHIPDRGPPTTHPIGIGREGFDTPLGATRIVRKAENPTWYPTEGKRRDNPELPAVVPPGPDNPLGSHALYLGWPTYLIHGTNKPYGVGRRVSRGCIRMYPEDIAALYRAVAVGTAVTVVDQPIKLGWKDGELFIEAHPTLAQLDELEERHSFTLLPPPDHRAAILAAAGDEAERVDWRTVEAELVIRRGLPIRITTSIEQAAQSGAKPAAPEASAPRGIAGGIY
jgi:L,D-transpeptidase ErfK/SrfK